MEWKRYKLSDFVVSIQTGPFGSQLHQSDYSVEGTPVIMPKDMVDGKIVERTIAHVSEEHVKRLQRYKVKVGDIIYSRRGDVGRCALVADNQGGWLCGTGCMKVEIDGQKALPSFLFYILQRKDSIGWLESHAVGSTMPNLNTVILGKMPVKLPPLSIQHRIASILSTYDTLIENNTKIIRLLEKMAENLYKEWFVRFRFPGHEKVEMVNGLPKGWKRGSLSDVCEFKRGKNITSSEMEKGNVPVISAGLEPSGYHSHSNVKGTSVTMSSSGANAGYIAIHYLDIWAADCSYIEESTTRNIYYVYELLNNIRGVITNFQRGAAQPHVYPKDINRIKLVLPSDELMQKANGRLAIMHKEIDNLHHQNTLLARQRDLLLPRLMSGKLEVKP